MVVINDKNYNSFLESINGSGIFLDYVIKDYKTHTVGNDILMLMIKCVRNNETYIINIQHQDLTKCGIDKKLIINEIIKLCKHVFVLDKKKFIHLFKRNKVEDLLIMEYRKEAIVKMEEEFSSNYYLFHRSNFSDDIRLNRIIPASKHIESFELKYNHYKKYIDNFSKDQSYNSLNGIITETLTDIESNGLYINQEVFNNFFGNKKVKVNNNLVYTEYFLLTATGRPSNKFGGVNYAALNKENGCRSSFISRHGEDGMLINMDYSAYHPRIIANLINFDIALNANFYEYIGKYYFKTDKMDEELIKKSKQITFQNLYGNIRNEYLEIPYYKKVKEYIEHRWDFFNENGYVETPIFKRRITTKHILDPSPSKLFNYILQASETEFLIQSVNSVNEYLKNKCSKVILYTYDSVLIDTCKVDGKDTLKEVKRIMENNRFPVKCSVGRDYQNMTVIEL